jgi:hypothetical protein
MFRSVFAAAAALMFAAACQPNEAAPELRPLVEEEHSVTAQVVTVEDGGYPQFTVTVAPDGDNSTNFYLNAEDSDLGGANPGDFAGKRATIYYMNEGQLDLVDMQASGRSVIPDAPAAGAGETLIGVLSGADAPTTSDLPDTLTITHATGDVASFDYYITPEIVALNGQEVTVRYFISDRNRVTLMRVAE